MAYIPQIKIGNDNYLFKDQNAFTLISDNTENIPENANADDYITAGNYTVVNGATGQTITNWPYTVGGRLIVMHTANSHTVLQIAIGNEENAVMNRIYVQGSGFTDWVRWVSEEVFRSIGVTGEGITDDTKLSDLNDAPVNSILTFGQSSIPGFDHFPDKITTGGMLVTLNSHTGGAGKFQIILPWSAQMNIAIRYYVSGSWSDWRYSTVGYRTITVGPGKDFENLADCLDYVTGPDLVYTWGENNRLIIQLDEGIFPMNKVATLYESDNTRYQWGLYVPMYCTLRGSGKDKTFLTYDYDGDDDWILGHLAPINMPYESAMENLTITAKNCRYCVHSDGDAPFARTWALSNNTITVKNVNLVHLGYSEGVMPTYHTPAAWGSGIRDNVRREFINCDFTANYMPWFVHDTTGQTVTSEILFKNCRFFNTRSAAFISYGEYAGPTFISWGTDILNHVSFENCYTNRYICLRPSVVYNPATTCDYFMYDDGNHPVYEVNVNDAKYLDRWIHRGCTTAVAQERLIGYRPVSIDAEGYASAYNPSSYRHGIALHTVDAGSNITVQESGEVILASLGITGFNAGDSIGYQNGNWVTDASHPILVIVNSNLGKLV